MKRSLLTVMIVAALLAPLVGKNATALRIIQTSSAGTTVCVIDPAANKVVGIVHDIEVNRASVVALDGSRIFVTGQSDSELAVVDAMTFQVVKRVPLDGHPDYISISKDGRQLYIALDSPGAVEVVDTTTFARVKSIPIKGAVHYAYVTPDGQHIVAASVAGERSSPSSTRNRSNLNGRWRSKAVSRPMAFETAADGSTRRAFVEVSDFHGFAVVDFVTHKEIARITLPDIPGKQKNLDGIQGAPAHGFLEITPDGKMLWATSKWYGYAYALIAAGFETHRQGGSRDGARVDEHHARQQTHLRVAGRRRCRSGRRCAAHDGRGPDSGWVALSKKPDLIASLQVN